MVIKAITAALSLVSKVDSLVAGVAGYESFTAGYVQATGKFVFAANPTANDYITIAGQRLTFKASAATASEVTIGANLSGTIDNLITKIAAHTTLSGLVVGTKTDTNTALTVTAKAKNGKGNTIALAQSLTAAATITAMSGAVNGQLSTSKKFSRISLSQSADQRFFLPDGVEGQEKVIYLEAASSTGDAVIEYNSTTIDLEDAGDTLRLLFANGDWRVIYVTPAPV
jgi:hypothetical protein